MVFNFHGYPWLIHRLTYRRPSQHNMHVRGYKEQGNINTPLELAIRNQTDRFTLAMDAIDRIARVLVTAAGLRDELTNQRIACEQYAYRFGIDRPDITAWKWLSIEKLRNVSQPSRGVAYRTPLTDKKQFKSQKVSNITHILC